MVSNVFNSGRQVLPRPKVCKSKPPGAPAPSVFTCSLTDVPASVGSFGTFNPKTSVNDPSQPPTAMIALTVTVDIGDIDFPGSVLNGTEVTGTWTGDGADGTATLEIEYSNGTPVTCVKTKQFVVTL